jgi:hypothetical protein
VIANHSCTMRRRSSSLASAWALARAGAGLLLLAAVTADTAKAFETHFAKHTAGSTKVVDHSVWDRQTKAYVVVGTDNLARVRYEQWKKQGHAELKRYVAALEKVDVAALDKPEQFAFWANLYNAKTIDVVLDAYPIRSIKDIRLGGTFLANITGGPWKAKIMKVGGQSLSLDDVEHGILRPIFKDPRVHYAVNCASIGCPNLMPGAFMGATLEAQLEAGAKAYVNHPRGISVAGGKVKASSIYSWFVADFGGNAASVLEHVRKYAEPALAKKLEGLSSIAEYDYDWALNEAKG